MKKIEGGGALKRLAMQQFLSSSAIGLISMPTKDINDFINCGIAVEKLWLALTDLNISMHPVNVPLIFFYKNSVQKNLNIPEKDKAILTNLEYKLKDIFSIKNEEQAMFMFRIFKATPSPKRTIRKSNKKILTIGRA